MSLADMTPHQRSEHMALIRGRDTKPEMEIRAFLREASIPFETHVETLPGTPDIVCADRKVIVFVHGCFWHQHGCRRRKPKVNRDYWEQKFAANVARDRAAALALRADGWRVLTVWECEARAGRSCRSRLLRALAPGRRLCHNCSHIAAPDYAMCARCYRRARKQGPLLPRASRGRDKDVRRRRRRLKLCITCGMPAGEKYSMCPAHAAALGHRRGHGGYSNTYKRLAEQGECRCHAKVRPGAKRCDKCLRKLRRDAKKRNQRYKQENRCRRCPLPPLPGLLHCEDHHKKTRESARKAMARFIKKRRDAEQCVTCKEPSKTYNCAKCREKIAKRAKKRQAV